MKKLISYWVLAISLSFVIEAASSFATTLNQDLAVAVYYNQTQSICDLSRKGADLNAKSADSFKFPLLYLAAINSRPEAVEALLECGANPNARDGRGTPTLVGSVAFLVSLKAGDSRIPAILKSIASLLKHGANPNLRDQAYIGDDRGALHLAAAYGNTALIQQLLSAGAQINLPNRFLETPLYSAAEHGQTQAVEILLKAGARADSPTKFTQMTPLQAAAERGHAAVAQLLLSRHVDPFHRNAFGKTPLDLAKHELRATDRTPASPTQRNGNMELTIQVLEKAAAKMTVEQWINLTRGLNHGLSGGLPNTRAGKENST